MAAATTPTGIWVPSSPCGPHCVHTSVPPVSRLRASVRIAALGTVGVGLLTVGVLTVLLPRTARHGYWRGSAKVALRTMGVVLDIDDHRPDGARRLRGALMVANHISFLDIIALC